jgi:hypothetical protein
MDMTDDNLLRLQSECIASYNAYAKGLDGKNWVQVRNCFADDVYIDYGPIIDPNGSPDKPKISDEWVAQLQFNIGGFDATRHTITNHRVSVDGESVSCSAYLIADHIMFSDPAMPIVGPESIATVIGEYTNHYRRVGNELKIFKSKLDIHWSTGNIDLFRQAIEKLVN